MEQQQMIPDPNMPAGGLAPIDPSPESLYLSERRDLFFARIMGGGYFLTEEELRKNGTSVDVPFPYRYFVIVRARMERWGELFQNGSMDRKDLNFIMRNVLQNSFPGTTEAAEIKGEMIAVVNLENLPENGITGIEQAARDAIEFLEQQFDLTVTITVSRIYESPMDLPRAYDDTTRVKEYCQLMGGDFPVTSYDGLSYLSQGYQPVSYLHQEHELLTCAKARDFIQMRKVLLEMMDVGFGIGNTGIETMRFRIYGAVNILLDLINEIRTFIGDDLINAIDPGPRLTNAESLADIVSCMDEILEALETHSEHRSVTNIWVEQIPSYVQSHYQDPDLNVASIADHFNLTSTYCSKIFKEQNNILLHDYIQRYRLDQAKILILSNQSLQEISDQVGFSNSLAMSRAFKKYEGLTPGRYRETHSN